MRLIIKNDLLAVLNDVLKAVEKHDHSKLSELSNHTIHDASIFQEDDPVAMAVLVYALSKIIQRCAERGQTCPVVTPQLTKAKQALENNDDDAYRTYIKNTLKDIGEYDSQLKMYIQEVLEQAKIKKGGKMYEHGISIARTAELLGLSQWELQGYIGKVVVQEEYKGIPVTERLRKARQLFK